MKVLIIGASGLVGGNCMKHFAEKGWSVSGTYLSFAQAELHFFDTLNMGDENNFDIQKFAPEVIVHCGAMTHVDACETEPEKSYQQTVQSTLNLLELAKKIACKFVYLSTDYVFDGVNGPYKEQDTTHPISIYGQHKLAAEQAVLQSGLPALVLRVTNIYGDEARGKNFIARIIKQCQDAQMLTLNLPYDQYASPTNAYDIARALFVLLQDEKQGIYHIGGTDYMNRVELAMNVLKHFPKAKYTLKPMSTADMKQPAARPLLGGFVKEKFSREYPDFIFSTVDDYVSQRLKS